MIGLPPTALNEDEDEDLEDLMVNLHKDRRSGIDRRHSDSASQFRLDVQAEYRAEIRKLHEELTHKEVQITELKAELDVIRGWQNSQEETLEGAKVIVHAGMALKLTISILLGVTAVIGGIAISIEAFRAWFK